MKIYTSNNDKDILHQQTYKSFKCFKNAVQKALTLLNWDANILDTELEQIKNGGEIEYNSKEFGYQIEFAYEPAEIINNKQFPAVYGLSKIYIYSR